MFIVVIAVPFLLAIAYVLYARIVRPSPVALGSVIPKVCVVSADEINEFCVDAEMGDTSLWRVRRDIRWQQLRVVQKYISQMTWNTKLFQQVARFEKLKIHPIKSSLDYETRETLALRLAEEATAVRWLLIKGQIALWSQICFGREIKAAAVRQLQECIREYKRLELDTVALVGMAKDECYYSMLVERLGLSNWNLIEGGSSSS